MSTPVPTQMLPGGDPLDALRGYRLPDPVGWWPPAPGWWVLLGLLLVAAAVFGWFWLQRRRCSAAARQAERELGRLRWRRLHGHETDAAAFVRRISILLRRYAMAKFPRREVAALTGEDWLAFLDAHGGGGRFRDGPGRQLLEAPYRRAVDQPTDALAELAADWLRYHREACR